MQRLEGPRRLARNRPLALVIVGTALSAFGDWLYLAALPIVVYRETGDPALLGLAAAGRLLPFFVLSVPAGAVADRFDRRRIIVAAETIRGGLMFAMALAAIVNGSVLLLIVLATSAAAAGTFALPAQAALIPELARDDEELGLANATSSTFENMASVLGPLVAGILVLTAGLAAACAINGLTFAAVVAILVRTRASKPRTVVAEPGSDAASEAGRGRSLIDVARGTAAVITLDAAVSFASGALGVLPVLIAVDALHAGEAVAGLLNAAGGVGAVAGGVAAGILVNRSPELGARVGILGAAMAIGALGVIPVVVPAIAACSIAVGALVMVDTLNITALQRRLPGASHGRAFGILHTSAAIWLIAGSAIPPIVAAAAGIQAGVLLTGAVVAVLGAGSVAIDRVVARPPHDDPRREPVAARIVEATA